MRRSVAIPTWRQRASTGVEDGLVGGLGAARVLLAGVDVVAVNAAAAAGTDPLLFEDVCERRANGSPMISPNQDCHAGFLTSVRLSPWNRHMGWARGPCTSLCWRASSQSGGHLAVQHAQVLAPGAGRLLRWAVRCSQWRMICVVTRRWSGSDQPATVPSSEGNVALRAC